MTPERAGTLLIVCAPSGAGKTTLISQLRQEFPRIGFSVSCTTRPPRPGEVDGKDYHFISEEAFLARRAQGAFAEWARVHGHLYGTPLEPIREALDGGQDLLFDIDVQGAAQLRLRLPRGRFVFILPPSLAEQEARLRGRGTDDESTILRRLAAARYELEQAHWFDAWIVNDDRETAYAALRAVYLAATLAPALRPDLATSLLEGR